ncbi:MAG: hypothetical protein IJN48_05310 [Clostridia bacterium]|nr:hypothetical protein [Clostridia bacterium]
MSCTKSSCLYDVIIAVTSCDNTFPAGNVICYGAMHDNSVSDDTLSEYLGLEGYPEFKDKIEELAVYCSIGQEYTELAAMKLYQASDLADGVLFFERRIKAAKRAGAFVEGMDNADNAYISVYGNTVVLFMLKDNKAIQKEIEKRI